ncbi:hypothetical protein [Cellulophaga baltica]|uniref:hypothetical protein n=1 Tax=Cellulophaga baltica TaxID=76594 RepID=UPI0015F5F4B5|nr:hypothetical protein [Cellulophaga baltica]MBA6316269.1 hypothetical protein [Cellulophaga baltica]
MKDTTFTKTHALIIVIGFIGGFLYPIIITTSNYFTGFLKGFLIGSSLGLIFLFKNLLQKENNILIQNNTPFLDSQKDKNHQNSTKIFSEKQKLYYIQILKIWFKDLSEDEAQKLARLEIENEIFLKKSYKPYSLLLSMLIHKNFYTKNQVEKFLLSEKIKFWSKKSITGTQLVSQNRTHRSEFEKADHLITLPKNKNSVSEKEKLIAFQKLLN